MWQVVFRGGGGGGGANFRGKSEKALTINFCNFLISSSPARGMAYSAQTMTILINMLDLARDFLCHEAASADLDK